MVITMLSTLYSSTMNESNHNNISDEQATITFTEEAPIIDGVLDEVLKVKTINQKKTIIILVPEISLTPQLSGKFINTFGDKVALWQSKLTKHEKLLGKAIKLIAEAIYIGVFLFF